MALSITQLSIYLTGCDSGPSTKITDSIEDIDHGLRWNGLSCLSVVSYVLKFCSVTNHQDAFQTIKRLEVLASEINKADSDDWELGEKIGEFAETFVYTFMPKVKKFFTLPEPESENNKHLAPFLHFILQVLSSELDHIHQMDLVTLHEDVKYLYGEMSFFLAVLGDTMFQYVEVEEVKNLLTEFNAMANQVGFFVYSSHTSPDNISSLCMEKVKFLNAKIEVACIEFQKLPQSMYVKPKNTDAADAVLIVNSLLEDLGTFLTPRVDLIGNVKDQTNKLHTYLVSVQSFLKDVNASRETESEQLKECILQIREASLEADYLINSFVVGNFPQWYLSIRMPNVIQKLDLVGKKSNEIRTTHKINVPKLEKDMSSQATFVAVDDNIFVGFETETREIRKLLTSGPLDLQTISVYGMPGLGKTTFARNLFNLRGITGYFDLSAWCTVSQTYHKRRVLVDILMGLRNLHSSDEIVKMGDYGLIETIYKTLKGRRYFIIMDDVWDTDALDDARIFCPNDKNGSRILFTTRNTGTTTNTIARTLPFLTNDQCWELIQKKVFPGKTFPKTLERNGIQIAAKCGGLPLTVVVIAGILASVPKEKAEWGIVEHSINTYAKSSMKVLELSYKHLPNHLKLCFLYFGAYPGNTEIEVQNLIWSWISEGFIQKDRGKSQEHVAREYLKHLVDRSLVRVTKHGSTGRTKSCGIHDLVREMCLKRATEENFMSLIDDDVSTYERHLRLSVSPATPTSMRPFSVHCRSFHGHLSDPSSCLPQMKHLRIMQLQSNECVNISYNLKRIDTHVHLKYLVVDRMPQVILDNLVNLEILVVNTNSSKVLVPSRILKMEKLRNLHVKREAMFQDCDSYQPNNLQSISFLSIRNTKDFEILTYSCHLLKLKCLCPPQLPDFRVFSMLKSLKIVVRSKSGVPDAVKINFPETIEKLSLSGTCFPWERMSTLVSLPRLQSLKLFRKAFMGKEWDTTDDEFQALKYLKLDGLNLEEWIASSMSFPVLEHLVLNKCDTLLDIPMDIGEIYTMKLIEVRDCSAGVLESVVAIEKQQDEYCNTGLKFITTSDK